VLLPGSRGPGGRDDTVIHLRSSAFIGRPTASKGSPVWFEDTQDRFTPLVARVLQVEEITWGRPEDAFIVRYRGRLFGDSAAAYRQLADALRPLDITPLFRVEDGRHAVILVAGVVRPKPSNPLVNALLLALTILSVFWVGLTYAADPEASTLWQSLLHGLGSALAYAASLMAILLAHEFGHYLAGRRHGTAVTLPYFLPLPLPPFGTLGAFIQMKEPPRDKRVLLDIAIAGPLAGLVVTVPVLLLGLWLSPLDRLPWARVAGMTMEGNSILYLLAKFAVFGRWLPEPVAYGPGGPLAYWLRYFFTASPLPYGGTDVLLHPVAWAGWAGLLVTGLNLIPVGQLDGGHLLYALFGRRAQRLRPVILAGLIVLALVWPGWWLWAGLILLFGGANAEPLDQITPLDPRRRRLAWLGLLIFVLVFTPVPLRVF